MADGQWSNDLLGGAFADPATFLITCCCPCVTYGMTATKVHGGSCVSHALACYLSACCGLQGLFAGPTRKAIRQGYKLPQVPRYLGSDDPSDFLVHVLGIISCFALCQEANEVKARNTSAPLGESPDPFTPLVAPKQADMSS